MVELFEGADPDEALGDTLTVFELLERGATRMENAPCVSPPCGRPCKTCWGRSTPSWVTTGGPSHCWKAPWRRGATCTVSSTRR